MAGQRLPVAGQERLLLGPGARRWAVSCTGSRTRRACRGSGWPRPSRRSRSGPRRRTGCRCGRPRGSACTRPRSTGPRPRGSVPRRARPSRRRPGACPPPNWSSGRLHDRRGPADAPPLFLAAPRAQHVRAEPGQSPGPSRPRAAAPARRPARWRWPGRRRVVGVREAAARRGQVFEDHHELGLSLVEGGVPDLRDAHREFVSDGRVEAGLGNPEAGGAQELALGRQEGLQLHEHRVGQSAGACVCGVGPGPSSRSARP